MKNTLTLLVLAFACMLPAFAQTNPYALVAFPAQLTATVFKNPGGAVWLPQAITIAVPLIAPSAHSYQVYSPLNYQSYTPIRFGPTASNVFNGTAYSSVLNQVFIQVDTDIMDTGSYTVPIEVLDGLTGSTTSVVLNLSVVDGHYYVYPDPGTKVVPHLASGAGWRTTLQLTNPNSTSSSVEVSFAAQDGTPTAFRLADGTNSAVVSVAINGYGTKSLVVEDLVSNTTLVGSARVKPVLGAPVNVTILYQTTDAAAHDSALPALPATDSTLTMFYDNTGGHVTGLALTNSLNYAEPVQVTYYDEDGTLLVTAAPITLNANGQTAFVVSEPILANRKGVIRVTMPFPAISGFVLRFNQDFQFIPILP